VTQPARVPNQRRELRFVPVLIDGNTISNFEPDRHVWTRLQTTAETHREEVEALRINTFFFLLRNPDLPYGIIAMTFEQVKGMGRLYHELKKLPSVTITLR
jgi:hypothetical protein